MQMTKTSGMTTEKADRPLFPDLKSEEPLKNRFPRYRGFNLLGRFLPTGDARFLDMRPGNPNEFLREDFEMIAALGFNFVRLPLSYWWWSSPESPSSIDHAALDAIDDAVNCAISFGLHVSLNFHHAPGYCVNQPMRSELFDLWKDADALGAFAAHWEAFSARYQGVPPEQLSFDLINEPPDLGGKMTREQHERVIRTAVQAIRRRDSNRLIIANGTSWGTVPSRELADTGIVQSCRGYFPAGVSHYLADWSDSPISEVPRWPGASHATEKNIGSRRLHQFYQPWRELIGDGVGVHCGEMGCWNRTPHIVATAWLKDLLSILKEDGIGWAMWNFRGSFGVLDSKRPDVTYEHYKGHLLDRQMLELLKAF